MTTMRDTRTAGALGVGAAAAGSAALATGFQRLLRHIDNRAEAEAVRREWQAALDAEADRADRAEAELAKSDDLVNTLLDEIAELENRLASRG